MGSRPESYPALDTSLFVWFARGERRGRPEEPCRRLGPGAPARPRRHFPRFRAGSAARAARGLPSRSRDLDGRALRRGVPPRRSDSAQVGGQPGQHRLGFRQRMPGQASLPSADQRSTFRWAAKAQTSSSTAALLPTARGWVLAGPGLSAWELSRRQSGSSRPRPCAAPPPPAERYGPWVPTSEPRHAGTDPPWTAVAAPQRIFGGEPPGVRWPVVDSRGGHPVGPALSFTYPQGRLGWERSVPHPSSRPHPYYDYQSVSRPPPWAGFRRSQWVHPRADRTVRPVVG